MNIYHRRRASVTAVAILAVVGVAAGSMLGSGSARAASKQPPFKIMVLYDLSGPLKAFGVPAAAAFRDSVNYVNARGGIVADRFS